MSDVLRCDECMIVDLGHGWLALQRDALWEDSPVWHFCSFRCLKAWISQQVEKLA